jgi:hypothetical protein
MSIEEVNQLAMAIMGATSAIAIATIIRGNKPADY